MILAEEFARDFINRRLAADHKLLLEDAERIAQSLNNYVSDLRRNPDGRNFSGDAVRIGTYLIQHAQAAAKLDAAREMTHVLLNGDTN